MTSSSFRANVRTNGRSSGLLSTGESATVNLTPMLDVVFILLIFFIVTAVFVREQGLSVSPPEPDVQLPPDIVQEPPIVVDLLANRRVLIAGNEVDERLMQAQLTRLHAQRPEAFVVIRPAPEATTDLVVRAMDAARSSGIFDLKFAARPTR